MAAILDEMRRLNAARRDGAMTEREFLDARSEILARVDDMELEQRPRRRSDPEVHMRTSDAPKFTSFDVFNIAIAMVLGSVVLTVLMTWLLRDLTLALTLTATVLAAITIRAVQKLDQ